MNFLKRVGVCKKCGVLFERRDAEVHFHGEPFYGHTYCLIHANERRSKDRWEAAVIEWATRNKSQVDRLMANEFTPELP